MARMNVELVSRRLFLSKINNFSNRLVSKHTINLVEQTREKKFHHLLYYARIVEYTVDDSYTYVYRFNIRQK